MKPKITMDEKPAVVIATVDHGETAKATSRRKLLIVGAVIGLACVVVIAGVSVGAFYLGMNAKRESYKEAWVNFEAGANKTIIKERVVVGKKEAEFRRPGVMNMVVDYENTTLKVPDVDEMFRFDGTEENVPLETLSPKAREMCYGAEILRVRKVENTDDEREKRFIRVGCKVRYRKRCYKVCFVFRCRRVCTRVKISCGVSIGT